MEPDGNHGTAYPVKRSYGIRRWIELRPLHGPDGGFRTGCGSHVDVHHVLVQLEERSHERHPGKGGMNPVAVVDVPPPLTLLRAPP